jgi:hypothetical protein
MDSELALAVSHSILPSKPPKSAATSQDILASIDESMSDEGILDQIRELRSQVDQLYSEIGGILEDIRELRQCAHSRYLEQLPNSSNCGPVATPA